MEWLQLSGLGPFVVCKRGYVADSAFIHRAKPIAVGR